MNIQPNQTSAAGCHLSQGIQMETLRASLQTSSSSIRERTGLINLINEPCDIIGSLNINNKMEAQLNENNVAGCLIDNTDQKETLRASPKISSGSISERTGLMNLTNELCDKIGLSKLNDTLKPTASSLTPENMSNPSVKVTPDKSNAEVFDNKTESSFSFSDLFVKAKDKMSNATESFKDMVGGDKSLSPTSFTNNILLRSALDQIRSAINSRWTEGMIGIIMLITLYPLTSVLLDCRERLASLGVTKILPEIDSEEPKTDKKTDTVESKPEKKTDSSESKTDKKTENSDAAESVSPNEDEITFVKRIYVKVVASIVLIIMNFMLFVGRIINREIMISEHDLRTAIDERFTPSQEIKPEGVVSDILSLLISGVCAIGGCLWSSKPMSEVLPNVVTAWGRGHHSCNSLLSGIKSVVKYFNPDREVAYAAAHIEGSIQEFQKMLIMSPGDFVKRQQYLRVNVIKAELSSNMEIFKDEIPPAVKDKISHFNLLYSKLLARITELNASISMRDELRIRPVFITLYGKTSVGKSRIIRDLYDEVKKRLQDLGLCPKDFRRLTCTGGGDNFVVPMNGGEQWFELNEYMRSHDDPFIGIINQLATEDATFVSSAFEKFSNPKPWFIVATANNLPTSFSDSTKNKMPKASIDAFYARHTIFEVTKKRDPNEHRDKQTGWETQKIRLLAPGAPPIPGKYEQPEVVYTTASIADFMVEEFRENLKRFNERLDGLDIPKGSATVLPESTQSSPRVLSIFGKPGIGKTHMLENLIMPYVELSGKIKKYNTLPVKPDKAFTFHVMDDLIMRTEGGLQKYKTFYDNCSGRDTIIIIDNYELTLRKRLAHFMGWFKGEFTERYWQLPDFKDVAMVRRLGISGRLRMGDHTQIPSIGRNMCIVGDIHGWTHLSSFQHFSSVEDVDSLVATFLSTTHVELEHAPAYAVLPQRENWDAEVRLPDLESASRYFTLPTTEYYVKFDPSLLASFPDVDELTSRLRPTHEETARALVDVFTAAYRRRPFSIKVEVGTTTYGVCDGRIYGVSTDTNRATVTRQGDGFIMTYNQQGYVATCQLIYDNQLIAPTERVALSHFVREVEIFKHSEQFQKYVKDREWTAWKLKVMNSKNKVLTSIQNYMMKNPKLTLLTTILSAAIASVAMYRIATTMWARAEHKGTKSKTAKPESYENKNFAKAVKKVTIPRPNPAPSTKETTKGIPIRSALPQELIRSKQLLTKASCFVSHATTAHGIIIKENIILTVAHVYDRDMKNEPIIITVTENGQVHQYQAEIHALVPERELLFVKITDKTFPRAKDITIQFLKDADLLNIHEGLHYFPSESREAACWINYSNSDISLIADNMNFTGSRLTVTYASSYVQTAPGDCGTPILAIGKHFQQRVVAGIHFSKRNIGTAEHTEYVSMVTVVTQEDIIAYCNNLHVETQASVPDFEITLETDVIGASTYVTSPEVAAMLPNDLYGGGYDFESSPRLGFIGYHPDLHEPLTRKRDNGPTKTTLSRHINQELFPDVMIPAPQTANSPTITEENRAKLMTHRGSPSIPATQMNMISGEHVLLDPQIKEMTTNIFKDMIRKIPGIESWKFLSLYEAINGIKRGGSKKILKRIDPSTSAGFPYRKLFNITKKEDMFERVLDGDTEDLIISDTPAGWYLYNNIHRLWKVAEDDKTILHIIQACLKVETLPIEKAARGGTRLFLAESADFFLFQRQIFGKLHELIMNSRWTRYQHHTVGLDPHTEFDTLYDRLKSMSSKGFDADYKKFDKRIPLQVWEEVSQTLTEVFTENSEGEKKIREERVLKHVFQSIYRKIYLVEGKLYEAVGDMPSGVFITNLGDSWLNDYMLLYSVIENLLTHGITPDLEEIHDNLSWFTHGDDLIVTVSSAWENIITFRNINESMTKIGMLMTPAQKHESVYDLKDLNNMEFVGRSFVINDAAVLGKLRESALLGMLHWTEDRSASVLAQTMVSLLTELRAYDRDRYNEYVTELSRVLQKVKITHRIENWTTARRRLYQDIKPPPAAVLDLGPRPTFRVIPESDNEGAILPSHHESTEENKDWQVEVLDTVRRIGTDTLTLSEQTNLIEGVQWSRIPKVTRTKFLRMHFKARKCEAKDQTHMDKTRTTENDRQVDKTEPKPKITTTPPALEQTAFISAIMQTSLYNFLGSIFYTIQRGEVEALMQLHEGRSSEKVSINGTHIYPDRLPSYTRAHKIDDPFLRTLSATWACIKCNTMCNGLPSLYKHLFNSHPREENHVVSPLLESSAEIELQYTGSDTTTSVKHDEAPSKIIFKSPGLMTSHHATPESAPAAAVPIPRAPVSPEVDANVAELDMPQSEQVTQGLDRSYAPAVPTNGMENAAPDIISLREPVLPPELAAITGPQWNAWDLARTAPELVFDGTISTTSSPVGQEIFFLPLHTYGVTVQRLLDSHLYVKGDMIVTVSFYGTTNTAGSIVVYEAESQEVLPRDTSNLNLILKRPKTCIEAPSGSTTTSFRLSDALPEMRNRKTSELTSDNQQLPYLRCVVWSPLVNTFGSDININIKVTTRPAENFRVWGPILQSPLSLTPARDYRLPPLANIGIENSFLLPFNVPNFQKFGISTPNYVSFSNGSVDLGTARAGDGAASTTVVDSNSSGYVAHAVYKIRENSLPEEDDMNVTFIAGATTPTASVSLTGITASNLISNMGVITDFSNEPIEADIVLENAHTMVYSVPNAHGSVFSEVVVSQNQHGVIYQYKLRIINPGQDTYLNEALDGATWPTDRIIAAANPGQLGSFHPQGLKPIWMSRRTMPLVPEEATFNASIIDEEWAAFMSSLLTDLAPDGEDAYFTANLVAFDGVEDNVLGQVKIEFVGGRGNILVNSNSQYLERSTGSYRLTSIIPVSANTVPNVFPTTGWSSRTVSGVVNSSRPRKTNLPGEITSFGAALARRKMLKERASARTKMVIPESMAIAGGAMAGAGSGMGTVHQNRYMSNERQKQREFLSMMMDKQQAHQHDVRIARMRNSNTHTTDNVGFTTPSTTSSSGSGSDFGINDDLDLSLTPKTLQRTLNHDRSNDFDTASMHSFSSDASGHSHFRLGTNNVYKQQAAAQQQPAQQREDQDGISSTPVPVF